MKHASTGKTTRAAPDRSTPAATAADRSDWERVHALRDADIAEDTDAPRTTDADWEGALMKSGGKEMGHTPRRRGPGVKPARTPIQLRLPPQTLARWKATGPGWQTRMAEALEAALPAP